MSEMPHEFCADLIKEMAAKDGVEVTVSTEPPLVDGPWTTNAVTCPHGTRYWFEPTGEQIAQWAADGVR